MPKKTTADEIDDFKYDGVNWECNVDSDYKLKKVWTMNDASIAKGYLKNEEDDYRLPFEDLYPMIETQEKAKEFIENEVNSLKENGIDCSDKYYYVIANEKKCW